MASERPSSVAPTDTRAQSPHSVGASGTSAQNQSPWWTAPSGKPISIPAFARILSIDALAACLFNPPRIPVRVKARRTLLR